MNVKRERIKISVYPPSQAASPQKDNSRTGSEPKAADKAVLRLARLLGRQIAREQFEHARSKNRHNSGQ